MKVQRFASIITLAACFALGGYTIWLGHRSVNPQGTRPKVETKLPPLTLEQISSLDQKTFERSLPQLQQAMGQPSHPVAADQETLTAIAGKLRQTGESAPGYWPTVLRFIQFASSATAPKAPPPGQRPEILSEILSRGLMRGIRVAGITMLLDDGNLGNGEFTNCRVIFTQNAVQLRNATFKNCVFELPVTDTPSPFIRKTSQLLLGSNLGSVSIPKL
jgi:hypothetical protein